MLNAKVVPNIESCVKRLGSTPVVKYVAPPVCLIRNWYPDDPEAGAAVTVAVIDVNNVGASTVPHVGATKLMVGIAGVNKSHSAPYAVVSVELSDGFKYVYATDTL